MKPSGWLCGATPVRSSSLARYLGTTQDEGEAVRWYRFAADQGHEGAQCYLGKMYADGRGVPWDEGEAVRLYRRAADAGVAAAMFELGKMYADGRGVAQDDGEAARWYRLAADQGSTIAGHAPPKTTRLYDRTADTVTVDEIERILI